MQSAIEYISCPVACARRVATYLQFPVAEKYKIICFPPKIPKRSQMSRSAVSSAGFRVCASYSFIFVCYLCSFRFSDDYTINMPAFQPFPREQKQNRTSIDVRLSQLCNESKHSLPTGL